MGDDSRKEQIMDAVIKLVTTVGVDKMTIRQIAKEAGVSHALVTYHYGNKTQLVGEAWLTALARYAAEINAEVRKKSNLARIEASFRVAFPDDDKQILPWRFWVAYWAEAARTPNLSQYHGPPFERQRMAYAGYIRDAIDKGELVPGHADPVLSADLFQALMYGLAVLTSIDEEAFSPNRALSIAKHALDVFRAAGRARDS